MMTERFFVSPDFLAEKNQAFTIPAGPLYRQIVAVLRMKAGDLLGLLPNDGRELVCKITEINRSGIIGDIIETVAKPVITPNVIVCAALLKRENFELILQKCTELGATSFLPLATERTIKKLSEVPERWLAIVREASEQSGRGVIPIIHEPLSFEKALAKTDGLRRVVLHEGHGGKLPAKKKDEAIALFIGPEGGFTEREITLAKDAGSLVTHLGDELVMRAETAAIAGLTLLRL
ncbi:TPA: hypothetical protein DEP96_04095 [Candidatus Uhrbacteria bacterium]|nr:hypothetical protein [Candidatus Uhrbacteria bacterium]